jgi:hypothetical protein
MGLIDNLFGDTDKDEYLAKRKQGYTLMYQAFSCLPLTPELDLTIDVKFKLRIVGSPDKYDYLPFRTADALGYIPAGYYDPNTDTMFMIGKRYNGKIVLDEFCLGHETEHNLKYDTTEPIVDPDKMDKEL